MLFEITSFVGLKKKNNINDVKLLQALLNVYSRRNNSKSLTITGKCDSELIDKLVEYQNKHLKISKPKEYAEPNGKIVKSLNELVRSVFKPMSNIPPKIGLLTWNAEGNEGGVYHSRKLHVPSESSGVTVGRGYDLRRKKSALIRKDLAAAGLKPEVISKLASAVGLKGKQAKQFIIDSDLVDYQVTVDAQRKLFKISYDFEASEVKRICTKSDVVKKYGNTDWGKLDFIIKEITIDLKFRGDYTPAAREYLQETIANNDLESFKRVITNRSLWANVPGDRFNKRVKYVQ
ncbi:pesticin C-terminus-like muramidase [Photobacterium sanguinicancri]|uniref:pesticin C-terminus-like muramidase n=1 Tax=Photobacterium sanguinicancri TaxID=875932 RepID=UPI003D0CC30B